VGAGVIYCRCTLRSRLKKRRACLGILSDIAVIGLADPAGWGEKVTAVVILKEGYALSLDDVKTHCRNKIAGYKIPKELKIVDIIPRNHSGKIKKLALKEQLMPK
jgi:fatty-acyl-CoA synthase